jgi:hypothetical protein
MVAGDNQLQRDIDFLEEVERGLEFGELGLFGQISAEDSDIDLFQKAYFEAVGYECRRWPKPESRLEKPCW